MASEHPEREGGEREGGDGRGGGKLWGARADFVASLGRKIADARDVMGSLEEAPSARSPRDELRRKLHALGAGARLLRFDAMAKALSEADAVLERAAMAGSVEEGDFDALGQVLDDLPALAWSEAPPRERSTPPEPASSSSALGPLAISALVYGGEPIADALSGEDVGGQVKPFECERTDVLAAAIEAARAIGPDVVVIDAEVAGAAELVEALLDDPLTEPVPIVVLGEFPTPESQARYVALGVARALLKPVTPDQLRHICEELVDQREGRTIRVTLGEPTMEQLGERLAEEVRRALVDTVDSVGRACRVPLGEGTEVLGAMWGAIARVREVVTARTGGAVRFGGSGPEGAIALAPWLHGDGLGTSRAIAARARGPATDVRLDGRRVVVADDDPGVTWFIGDLLRAAGCEVHEALDGRTALGLCYRLAPELVVSDILMPELDGFALSRALKHDVALRDTPVILLSWKEDLLQRVRELGAGAAAYLRKESDSRAILARVREVLRPRVRVETRLRGEGEVRGRLDGLTVHSLLELVCRVRRSARISVRDASYLYEVEVRDGAPRRATRTAADGSFQRGERVIATMLGIGAGRFVVAPSTSAIQGDLAGNLSAQIARPVAAARGALHAVTGQSTVNVHGLVLDESILEGYLRATPEPMRDVIRRLARGASPRGLLLSGEIAPTVLEDVLADLAVHGAITAVRSVGGDDLLSPAVTAALAVIEGRTPPKSTPPLAAASKTPSSRYRAAWPVSEAIARDLGVSGTPQPGSVRPAPRRSPPPPPIAREAAEGGAPSSLADAVMRELVERGSEPPPNTPEPPAVFESSALRPRSSPPAESDEEAPVPSLGPDAIVPASSSGDAALASTGSSNPPPFLDEPAVVPPPVEPVATPEPPSAIAISLAEPFLPSPSADPPHLARGFAAPEPSIPIIEGTPAPSATPAPGDKTDVDARYAEKAALDAELQQTPPPAVASRRDPTKARGAGSWVFAALFIGSLLAGLAVYNNDDTRSTTRDVGAGALPPSLETRAVFPAPPPAGPADAAVADAADARAPKARPLDTP